MDPTQQHRFAAVETSLGPDRLLLRHFSGREELGRLFDYSLTLIDPFPDQELDSDILIGKNVSVRVQLESGEDTDTRYFNGFIASVSFLGHDGDAATYHARMVPWLWLLTRTSDCRSFSKKTVPEIVEQVFKDYGFDKYELKLTGQYQPRTFVVQYNETAFNFVSRLLEHEGIYYWWRHSNGEHHMVITDAMSTHEPNPHKPEIEWRAHSGSQEAGYIYSLRTHKNLSPGAYALNDYNFKKPDNDLRADHRQEMPHDAASFEYFEYPGLYGNPEAGTTLSAVRLQEVQANHETVEAQVTARAIATGYTCSLTKAERDDLLRDYLVLSTAINVTVDDFTSGGASGGGYDCHVRALPTSAVFRPARITPKPLVQGPQPAQVVGPEGEEIHCDQYGRVKVHFYWDRRSLANEDSSCWVRVSQPSAGNEHGFMSLPRVGQEVLVEFLNGDPDQPIITGRVYNGANAHPYDPATMKTRSSWKTNTYPHGGGFNELRFDDAKGKEQIFIHGETYMDTRVKSRSRAWTGGDSHHLVGRDRLEKSARDKHETVGRHLTEQIKENHFSTTGGDSLHTVQKAFQLTAEESIRLVTSGDTQVMSFGNVSVLAGKNMVLEAGAITLSSGGNFIRIGPNGIVIEGTAVWINSNGGTPDKRTDLPAKAIELPTAPEEAHDSTAGRVDHSKGMGHRLTAHQYPGQTVADYAAQHGRPFIETLDPANLDAGVS